MAAPQRPTIPPQVLQALQSGNKIEAIKLLRQAASMGLAEAKNMVDALDAAKARTAADTARQGATSPRGLPAHHKPAPVNPYLARRPGLSPGEMPRTGADFGWVMVLLAGLVVAYLILP